MAIALSWSRLSDYQQCPKKFYLKYIEKSFPPEDKEKSIHLIKGEELHKQMEDYVMARNGQAPMPAGFSEPVQQTIKFVDGLFTVFGAVYPEAQVACKPDWTPEDWFGKNVMYRAIWDVIALSGSEVFIGDYKSGKVYPYGESYGQLDLSGVIALHKWPELGAVDCAYIYMEHKKTHKIRIIRDESMRRSLEDRKLSDVQAHFERQFVVVNEERKWEPKQNENCKWCPATKKQCPNSRKL